MSPANSSYKLVGKTSDLRKYANSQVEIKGALEGRESSSSGNYGATSGTSTGTGTSTGSTAGTTGGTGTSSATGSASGYGSSSNMPTLHVSSVRQISSTCSGAAQR